MTDTSASAARATVGSSRMRVAVGWVCSWRSTSSMTRGCRAPMMKTPYPPAFRNRSPSLVVSQAPEDSTSMWLPNSSARVALPLLRWARYRPRISSSVSTRAPWITVTGNVLRCVRW